MRRIVPIAVSYSSTRSDWDAAAVILEKLSSPARLCCSRQTIRTICRNRPRSGAIRRRSTSSRERHRSCRDAFTARPSGLERVPIYPDASAGSRYEGAWCRHRQPQLLRVQLDRNKTTSYIVTVYSREADDGSQLRYRDQDIVYFGGDIFIGRWLTQPLADPKIASRVVQVCGASPAERL